jgi:predicted aspartyl protease
MRLSMIAASAFLALVMAAGAAAAECISAPDLAAYQSATASDFAAGPARSDRLGRVVAPVNVNGAGPFRFIVDTGANRSVVSEALAAQLGITAFGTGDVHSVYGVSSAPLAHVRSLHYGELALGGDVMPIMRGAMLAGEQGLLGVDGMQGRRLRMDFERNCIEIVPSSTARRLRGWAALRGVSRFGNLVVVQGVINGVRVHLFLDTGSDSTLANIALRDALNARVRRDMGRVELAIAYTAGRPVVLNDAILISQMSVGSLLVRNVTAYVGDFHIFDIWGLADQPALLIGMDVLSQTRGLAIDYGRGIVYLHIHEVPQTGTRLRY